MRLLHQSFFILMKIIGILSQETTTSDDFESEIVFRVINGRAAKLGDAPYQLSLRVPAGRRRYQTFCGGTILTETKLLSAAHCFVKETMSDCCRSGRMTGKSVAKYFAVAGTLLNSGQYNRRDTAREGQWRRIRSVVFPSDYKFPQRDIAVLRTRKQFIFNDYVKSIPYARVFEEYKGPCLVSGYGRTSSYSRQTSPILLLADLEIIPTSQCSRLNRRKMNKFVCTSDQISNVEKGDSGGPLVCKNTLNKNEGPYGVLVGVVSGKRVRRGAGAFYTRVSSYKKFIKSEVCLHTVQLPVLIICFLYTGYVQL